jgi:hypothetical protein
MRRVVVPVIRVGLVVAMALRIGCGQQDDDRVEVAVNGCSPAGLRRLAADDRLNQTTKVRLLQLAERASRAANQAYSYCADLSTTTSRVGWAKQVDYLSQELARGAQ